jgi:hypothetical protein
MKYLTHYVENHRYRYFGVTGFCRTRRGRLEVLPSEDSTRVVSRGWATRDLTRVLRSGPLDSVGYLLLSEPCSF